MQIGVVGAGVMGACIAGAFAAVETWQVWLCDLELSLAENGKNKLAAGLAKAVNKGRMTEADKEALLSRISVGTLENMCECDIVVEAVKEDLAVKVALFTALAKICTSSTVFASNTSALSISQMAKTCGRPVIGMHFFNPVSQMKLVEVVCGEETDPTLCEKVCALAEAMGKTPIIVRESPGFVVNRLLLIMVNEAVCLYSEGVASAKDIDTAMCLGANHPIGPLALADLIGLDVCLAILQVLHVELRAEKYRPHPLLAEMVAQGQLGRKTGKGFYPY